MARWKIKNNLWYGPVGDRHKLTGSFGIPLIRKPWVAVYIGPDYHDGRQAGSFKTWQEAFDYVKSGGTPFGEFHLQHRLEER